MKKIIKIAIIIFLHSTFYTKDDKSRESKNSLRLHGLKTAAAAAVGAAGAIGLKHLAQKSNLASKVRIQPFNEIFQKLEQNSIKKVGFSGALLAVGLYGTYTIYDFFKNKKSGARKTRREEEQPGDNPVVKVNAKGDKVEIKKLNIETEVLRESKITETADQLVGQEQTSNSTILAPAAPNTFDRSSKEEKSSESPVTEGKLQNERANRPENVVQKEEGVPDDSEQKKVKGNFVENAEEGEQSDHTEAKGNKSEGSKNSGTGVVPRDEEKVEVPAKENRSKSQVK